MSYVKKKCRWSYNTNEPLQVFGNVWFLISILFCICSIVLGMTDIYMTFWKLHLVSSWDKSNVTNLSIQFWNITFSCWQRQRQLPHCFIHQAYLREWTIQNNILTRYSTLQYRNYFFWWRVWCDINWPDISLMISQ